VIPVRQKLNDKPSLSSLTFFGFYLTAVLDRGKGQDFTFEEVYRGIENGTLLDDLDRALPDSFDFSIFRALPEQRDGLFSALRQAGGGLEGRERRKTGVEHSGIALLLAFILEAIQSHSWK
jgi:hypothetical protein